MAVFSKVTGKMLTRSPKDFPNFPEPNYTNMVTSPRPTVLVHVNDSSSTTTLLNDTANANDNKIHHLDGGDVAFILIPLLLIIFLACFSGFALVCMQRRRKFDRLRHRLIPVYNFTTEDDDEWGVLIDNDNNARSNSR